MDQMPINVVIFGSIPEAALIISLGLILIGIRPPLIKIALIAMLQGVAAYYIRKTVGFGLHTLLQYTTMCILVWRIIKIPISLSALGVIIGVAISSLVEGLMLLIIPKLIDISLIEVMSRSWLRVCLFLPQLGILLLIVYICLRNNFTLESEIGLLKINIKKKDSRFIE